MTGKCPVCGNDLPGNAARCPSCGFKLQGATESFTPISLTEEVVSPQSESVKAKAVLSVVRGPQTGVTFELSNSEMEIGRSPQCDIFLNDMTVSRQHARLVPADGGYTIYDTNSFNGVWINNKNVTVQRLTAGDIIQIGAFCFLYKSE